MYRKPEKTNAFTLIELLTVILILTVLTAILIPSLRKAKRSALALLSSCNQREVAGGVFCYAADQDGIFPESVATLGTGNRWSWREPTVLTGFQKRSPGMYRSVSQYLGNYIEKASTAFCPGAPSDYEFAQQAWDAGDAWDNPSPDTDLEDPLFGNYCLYWNYIGYLEEKNRPFLGPRSTARRKTESTLLISDYFGYGHWRNELTYGSRNAYGSCEKMARSEVTSGTSVACDFWSLFAPEDSAAADALPGTLHAGFIDGHVEDFSPEEILTLKVSMNPDGTVPYPDTLGPAGTFYIPRDSW